MHPGGSSGDPPKGVRGGYKQKLQWQQASSSSSSPSGKSYLATLLVSKFVWGEISAPLLQQVAAAAFADGATHPDIKKLADLGTSGKHSGNCHSDLMSKLAPNPVSDILSPINVYVKRPPQNIVKVQHTMLLPHELFAAIHQHHPAVFQDRLCGGSDDNIGSFWSQMRDHPAYHTHPLKDRDDHCTRCIPVSLHGDGVAISGGALLGEKH